MGNKINEVASFWTRALSRLIDLLFLFAISVGAFMLMTESKGSTRAFLHPSLFYVYSLILIISLIVQFIIVPIYSGGKTIGHMILKIKIVNFDNKKPSAKEIMSRELFISLSWVMVIILIAIVMNHTLFINYASTSKGSINFTNFEEIRMNAISTISGFIMLLQLVSVIYFISSKKRTGIIEKFSSTNIVFQNRFIEEEIMKDKDLSPIKVAKLNIVIERGVHV